MPIFDVPGWSLSSDPATEAGSRKPKRPPSDTGSESQIHSAEINLEKLVKKLTGKRAPSLMSIPSLNLNYSKTRQSTLLCFHEQ